MAKDEKMKVLTYRRADFLALQPENGTLQHYLARAHEHFPLINHRRVAIPNKPHLEGRNCKHNDTGFFLHIAAYTPGEETTVVPKLDGVPTGDVATMAPPATCEFMDGDISALVSGNHVILCASNLHEKNAEMYMVEMVRRAKINEVASRFVLSKVAKTDKLQLIKKQGVKSVCLDANLYHASLEHMERTTFAKSLSGKMGEALAAMFLKDPDKTDLSYAENLSVKVVLSYDQRKKKAVLVGEQLKSIATELVDDPEEGFSIITGTGEVVRPDDVVLKKKKMLPRHGKTVYCQSAWDAMESYFLELKNGGHLEL